MWRPNTVWHDIGQGQEGCELVGQSDLGSVFDHWSCRFLPCLSFRHGNTPAALKASAANWKKFLDFRQHFGEFSEIFTARQAWVHWHALMVLYFLLHLFRAHLFHGNQTQEFPQGILVGHKATELHDTLFPGTAAGTGRLTMVFSVVSIHYQREIDENPLLLS